MGEIVLLSETMPDLLPMQGRSDGLHVSDIITSLCLGLGIFKANDDGTSMFESDPNVAWRQLGCALEHATIERLIEHEPDRYVRLGELEKDGVFGTPDLYDLRDEAIEEIKLSWMSANQDVTGEKFWRYWVQVKAYCWMWGTPIGRIRVIHMNGDYSFTKRKREGTTDQQAGPIYRHWQQTFTEQELAENWQMLLTHGATLVH